MKQVKGSGGVETRPCCRGAPNRNVQSRRSRKGGREEVVISALAYQVNCMAEEEAGQKRGKGRTQDQQLSAVMEV